MEKLLFTSCILAYFAAVVFLVLKAKQYISDMPTVANRLYSAACAVVYLASVLHLTSKIKSGATIMIRDVSGNPFSAGSIISYGFIWFVFFVLYGSMLTVILFIPHTVYIFAKYPNTTRRTKLPDDLHIDMWPSMYAAGAAVAYNMILYAFGLTDKLMII